MGVERPRVEWVGDTNGAWVSRAVFVPDLCQTGEANALFLAVELSHFAQHGRPIDTESIRINP